EFYTLAAVHWPRGLMVVQRAAVSTRTAFWRTVSSVQAAGTR
ncbi:hypothetical protein BZL29_8508, partial [Mycobacterium kansasii]